MSARIKASSSSARVSASSFFLVRISPRPVLARPDFSRSKKVGGGGASPKVLMPGFSYQRACQMRTCAARDGKWHKGSGNGAVKRHAGKAGGVADAAPFHQHGLTRTFQGVQMAVTRALAPGAQPGGAFLDQGA